MLGVLEMPTLGNIVRFKGRTWRTPRQAPSPRPQNPTTMGKDL